MHLTFEKKAYVNLMLWCGRAERGGPELFFPPRDGTSNRLSTPTPKISDIYSYTHAAAESFGCQETSTYYLYLVVLVSFKQK